MAGWLAPTGGFRTTTVPKAWFFGYSAGSVFLLPFVNVFYRSQLGFSEEMIGVLCALKPFVAAIGDATQRHMVVLLAVYLVAFLGRSLMAFFVGFGVQLAIALATEAAASPMGSLIDAAVMACQCDEGGYGRIRMWASVGWGGTAPIAGAVVGAYGLKAAFLCFTALVGLMLLPTVLLPVEALAKKAAVDGASAEGPSVGCIGRGSTGSCGPRLSCQGGSTDKMGLGLKGRGSSRGGSEDGASLLSVHVSGPSQQQLLGGWQGSGHGRASKPAPLADQLLSWTISSSAEAIGPPTRAVISLTADATSAGSNAPSFEFNLPPSPTRPLLDPSSASPLPSPAQPAGTTSPLEIAVSGGSMSSKGIRATTAASAAAAAAAAAAEGSVWQGIKSLLADVHVLVFLGLALCMGIGNGAIGYLFLYLDELGATGTLMGLCLSFNCAAEVPVFFFSGTILQRIGVERALQVAMGVYVVRLTCYLALPLMPTPWLVLPVELLQGATFALAWSAGTVHVKRIAPPHLRGTVQSIFAGLYTGIGAGLGGLFGGLLYGSFGAFAVFRTAALTLAAGWLGANAVLRVWGGGAAGNASAAGAAGQPAGCGEGVRQEARASSEDCEDAALLLRP